MTLSLRDELELVSEEEGLHEIEEAMYANKETRCEITSFNSKIKCSFKITKKDMEEKFDDDIVKVSQALWTHRYDHCRAYYKRCKTCYNDSMCIDPNCKQRHCDQCDDYRMFLGGEMKYWFERSEMN